MVLEFINKIYECPYCGEEYDDEEDAQECASDCYEVDSPIEKDNVIYICEMCKLKYNKEEDAEDCEDNHIKKKDKLYDEYLKKKETIRMLVIANNPNQQKLEKWGMEKWTEKK